MKKFLLLALASAGLALTACQEAPVRQSIMPAMSFSGKAPIRVNVAQVNVVEQYRSPMQAPNVEHQFTLTPAIAIKQWAGQRLVASGRQGSFELTIEDASVRESILPKKGGVTGFFTDQQDARYDARMRAVLRLYDGMNTISVSEGDVTITRMRTINEKATLAEREQMFNDMVAEMMTQFDLEAEARLRQYFAAHLN